VTTARRATFTPEPTALEKAHELILELESHLDYTGWGDSWERECSEDLRRKLREFNRRPALPVEPPSGWKEQASIVRRSAERALRQAQSTSSTMVDITQHLVDEALRLEKLGDL
jgi:hypothetical protein